MAGRLVGIRPSLEARTQRYCSLLSNLAYFYGGVAESTSLMLEIGSMMRVSEIIGGSMQQVCSMHHILATIKLIIFHVPKACIKDGKDLEDLSGL